MSDRWVPFAAVAFAWVGGLVIGMSVVALAFRKELSHKCPAIEMPTIDHSGAQFDEMQCRLLDAIERIAARMDEP